MDNVLDSTEISKSRHQDIETEYYFNGPLENPADSGFNVRPG